MPTRQLVSVDDEAPVPPANGTAGAVVTAASVTAPTSIATAVAHVSSAPPQQSSSTSGASSGTSANNSTSTEAKTVTVTPKKDEDDESSGKKAKKKAGAAGRSKKGGKELPPNQRTLGSFFGAGGAAKKSKPKANAKSNAKPQPSSTAESTNAPNSTSEVVNVVAGGAGSASMTTTTTTDTDKGKKSGAGNTKPKPKPKSKSKSKAKPMAAKNKIPTANSTAEATSDKIKAIVLGSSRKKAAAASNASASASVNSSAGGSPTTTAAATTTMLLADGAGIATANAAAAATGISAKGKSVPTAALIGIPNGAIPSQKQIQQQEEREEQERAREERKRLLQQQQQQPEKEDKDSSEDEVDVEEAEESDSAPSASFVSPTPPTAKNKSTDDVAIEEPQEKKAKKRATLIPVTTAVTAEAAEHPTEMELDKEPKEDDDNNDDDDDDVVMIMDDEDSNHHLTDTAAKGSAVEGTKVLDVTLGKDSDDDVAGASSNSTTTSVSGSGGGGGDQDVSKKLNFATPNKSKNAPVFGGLDAFAVPISSIKASKKAKAAAAAKEAASIEGNSYVTKRVAKEFDDGNIYRGTVTKYSTETEGSEALWHIVYDDNDEEDLNLEELRAAVNLFESEEAKAANAVAVPVSAPTMSLAATTAAASSLMASASTTTGSATAATTPAEEELPDEFKEVLAKHEALRKRYRTRAEDLVQRSTELFEEEFERTVQPKEGSADEEVVSPPEDGQFPESLLSVLAVLIQGSPLPLSTLTSNAVAELGKRNEGKNLTSDIVSAKIKILASRKQYLTPLTPPESGAQVDKFEDTQTNLMWRWELTTIELLPATLVKKAKKVVSERRKLQNFFKAVVKLLSSLDKADALFLNSKSPKVKRDSALAKISADEDKVLKFEREEEKQRLIRETKAQKEKAKLEVMAQKEKAKNAAAEKKELEKKAAAEKREQEKKAAAAKRKEESERKKVEAAKAKEDAKRKKEEEKAAKKRKAEAKVEKQRACMASFFGASSPPRSKTKTSADTNSSPGSAGSSKFDSDAFWKSLGMEDFPSSRSAPFKKLSQQAKESRKRKTKEVAVTVFATVMPDNPFDQQPYDEERILKVPNKYKFLAFHEDYRPPYYGTWSKPQSSIVTGRNPLGRDADFLDYDVDSEAEWEEGDDEEGEDCEIDGPDDDDDEEDKIDGEEGDTRMYNYDDGWLAQDDEYDVEDNEEDNDEDTLAMRKRKAAEAADANKKQGLTLARVCVVAPVFGGIPLVEAGSDVLDCPELVAEHVDGAEVKIGKDLLSSHKAFDFMPSSENCLDLFPAPKSKKSKKATDKDGSSSSPSKAQASKEMSQDDLRAFAKFVHNSTLGSKDKVIEELQTALPDITSSRAQATRKLDSIAEKRRLKYGGGVVWEVKSAVLESLNLQAADLNPAPVEKEPEKKAAKSPKRKKVDKKEKDPNAPKRPSSAYIFYSNANRQKLKEANKEASNADLLKLLGESWKALSAEEKQPYEQMAANDKERYQKEMAAYKPESSEEPAEKKAKIIDIQEIWKGLKFKKVETADLISDSKVNVLVKHKESLFKATIHKSRVNGDSYDFSIQYYGNKATTLHWKPASHIMALLDEKDEPIVDNAVAAVSDEASSQVAESVVTAETFKSDASTNGVVGTTEPSEEIAAAKPTVESPAKSPIVANSVLMEPATEAKVVADDAGNETNVKQQSVSGSAVAAAEGAKIVNASSIDKKPAESSDATAKSGKKRSAPVSAGSKNLLASFLKKKAKKN